MPDRINVVTGPRRHARYTATAKAEGLDLSEWIRRRMDAVVDEAEREAPPPVKGRKGKGRK